MKDKKLSILFRKNGFSFSVWQNDELLHSDNIKTSNNADLEQTLNNQLLLQQTYAQVFVSILSTQFNLVPNRLFETDEDAQKWLEFNAEVYENDIVTYANISHDAKIVYAYPKELLEILNSKFGTKHIRNASEIFVKSIICESEKTQVFVNFHWDNLEVLILNKEQLLYYNIFEISCKEDVVYYILNVYKQLQLDPNVIELYYFGKPQDEMLKMLMNFVRHVMPGVDNATLLQFYSEFKMTV